jgi:hypothetical protein
MTSTDQEIIALEKRHMNAMRFDRHSNNQEEAIASAMELPCL